MSKALKKLDDLFHDTLKDVYFAEKKILTTLPKMAKAANSAELKKAFEKHHGETEGQVKRLEQVFGIIDKKPQAKTCDAIMGIVKEGQEVMDEYRDSPALDAGLLAVAQAVDEPHRGQLVREAGDLVVDQPGGLARIDDVDIPNLQARPLDAQHPERAGVVDEW